MKKLLFLICIFTFNAVCFAQYNYKGKYVIDFYGNHEVIVNDTRILVNDGTIIVCEKHNRPVTYYLIEAKPERYGEPSDCIELNADVYGYDEWYIGCRSLFDPDDYYVLTFRVITAHSTCTPITRYFIIQHKVKGIVQETSAYFTDLQ